MIAVPEFKIFAGSSHPSLARAITGCLGLQLGRLKTVRYSNENIKVKIDENVRGCDTFVVQTSCPPVSDGIIELLILIDALKYASADRVTAIIPYFPYVRSDKKDEPRISITARLIADLLQTAGADRVLTMDLHSPQIQGFFRIPVDQLTAIGVICEYFKQKINDEWVLVAPDAGEAKDAGRYAKRLDVPLAVIDKRRFSDDERPQAERIIGDVKGKKVFVVDDEVATAGTLIETVRMLRTHGALSVCASAVHPVLSGPAIERIRNSDLDELAVTDTIPIAPEKMIDKIKILSVASLLAKAVERIHDGRSVSALFG
ncbi:MAG: ribose-phosphate pyrophosphokinase [Pseudomonadota bacterium]